jgi:hypothetical protein
MNEADGMDDAVDGAMRTGPMVASRIGEQLARMREEEQRTIAAAEEHRARQLQERFDAQRAAARAQLAPVARDDWWDKANPEMIERAHQTATAWKAYDPEAAQASVHIRGQVKSRYGIDVPNTGAGRPPFQKPSPGHSRPALRPEANGPKPRQRAPMKWWQVPRLQAPTGRTMLPKLRMVNRPMIPMNAGSSWPKASKARETTKRSTPASWQTSTRARRRRRPLGKNARWTTHPK